MRCSVTSMWKNVSGNLICFLFMVIMHLCHAMVDYTGHQVLRVYPRSSLSREKLAKMVDEPSMELDLWSEYPVDRSMEIRVPPHIQEKFKVIMDNLGVRYEVEVNDVQRLIDLEAESRRSPSGFSRFHLDDHDPIDNMNLMMGDQAPQPAERRRRGRSSPRTRHGHRERHRRDAATQETQTQGAAAVTESAPGTVTSGPETQEAPRPVAARLQSDRLILQTNRLLPGTPRTQSHPEQNHDFYWTHLVGTFPRHGNINAWLDLAQSAKPDIVSVIQIGRSYQRREMKVIKIGKPKADGSEKPGIWIDSGIHGREWVTPTVAIFIIDQLVREYGHDGNITSLVETYDWFILPVVNPDGYEFTHTHNRLWRKSMRPDSTGRCTGVDLNRNFGYHWNNCDQGRRYRCGSARPCAHSYIGTAPFSEPETAAIRNFFELRPRKFKLFFSFHSYVQMWLMPWGYTSTVPSDNSDVSRVAHKAVEALKAKHGLSSFLVGSPATLLHTIGGTAMDWAKGAAHVKYSYAPELRGMKRGFLIEQGELVPAGEETWAAVMAAAWEVNKELTAS